MAHHEPPYLDDEPPHQDLCCLQIQLFLFCPFVLIVQKKYYFTLFMATGNHSSKMITKHNKPLNDHGIVSNNCVHGIVSICLTLNLWEAQSFPNILIVNTVDLDLVSQGAV